ncbi:hypothetical protein V6N13_064459 [Hibiscus sabdariffa]
MNLGRATEGGDQGKMPNTWTSIYSDGPITKVFVLQNMWGVINNYGPGQFTKCMGIFMAGLLTVKIKGPHQVRKENSIFQRLISTVKQISTWLLILRLRKLIRMRIGDVSNVGTQNAEGYQPLRLNLHENERWKKLNAKRNDRKGKRKRGIGHTLSLPTRKGKESLVKGELTECMAEKIAKLMENLQFSEEELIEVGEVNKLLDTSLEGSEKWLVGKTLQRKNGVCNSIIAKRSKQNVSNVGNDKDELSEATSPIKPNTTVWAASQPRREP